MKTQHTPGPWTAEEHTIGAEPRFFIQKSELVTIAAVNGNCLMYSNGPADAKLIAAAPELLEACETAKKFLESDLVEPGRTVFWKLVDAIAKATQS